VVLTYVTIRLPLWQHFFEQQKKVLHITRGRKSNTSDDYCSIVNCFCSGFWGVDIKKSPRGVGRESAL